MRRLVAVALVLLACGCAVQPPAAPVGLTEVASRPAEKALLAGIRAYEDAMYAESERQLKIALEAGLASAKDRAAAHKHLAFIYCTSNRPGPCEAAFRAAHAADPGFVLGKSEAGHPVWGPVYKRVHQ